MVVPGVAWERRADDTPCRRSRSRDGEDRRRNEIGRQRCGCWWSRVTGSPAELLKGGLRDLPVVGDIADGVEALDRSDIPSTT
jgi:hypothetical protein